MAFCAVLGYVAKKPLARSRYQFRIVMEFKKSSPSRSTGVERGSYYVTLDLLSTSPAAWSIEKVENDRPLNKDRNYPELKKFEFYPGGSAQILVDHSKAKEYSLDLRSDNRRGMEIEYNSAYGNGTAKAEFTAEYDQVTIRDYGPTPYNDFATIEADIRFDEIKKL